MRVMIAALVAAMFAANVNANDLARAWMKANEDNRANMIAASVKAVIPGADPLKDAQITMNAFYCAEREMRANSIVSDVIGGCILEARLIYRAWVAKRKD